jgi:sulfide dehydrogenase [flavocytochrome c] flavoprotein chain
MPHAWRAGPQTVAAAPPARGDARGRLVVMTIAANPFRCPPGPYERASLIAHYLKTQKPRSKLLLLDAKDAFSKQRLFQQAWSERSIPASSNGCRCRRAARSIEVDARRARVVTDFGTHKATSST